MSVSQNRAARRKGKLYRRINGPKRADLGKMGRRMLEKIANEKARAARAKGGGK